MATSPSSSGLTAAEGLAGYDTLLYAQSISSSTAHTELHLPSNVSGYAPSLLRSEATPTESSISTGLASRLSGFQLLEEVDGVLEVVGVLELRPNLRSPVYECTFWFLSCCYISADKEEWRTHCASHFRGEEPPKSVQCPLCEEFKTTYEDGHYAWKERIEHVAWHHELGQTLKTSRPDFHLIQHLWQKRLIGDDDLKELNGVWHLSSNDGGVENLPSVREQKTPLRIVPSDYNRKVLAWLDSLDAPEYLATQRDSPAPKEVDKTEALTDAAKAANTKYQIDEDGPDIRLGTTSPRLSHFISVMEHPPSPPVRQEILLPTVLEALLVEPSLNPSPPNPESEAIQLPTVLEAPLVEPSLDPSPLNLESQAAIRLPTVLEAPLAKPLHDPSPPNLELEAAIRPPTVQQVPVINPSLDPLPLSAEELEAELLIPAVLEAQSIEPSFEPSSVEPSRTTSEESNAHSKKRRRGTETHDVESSNVMSKKCLKSSRQLSPRSGTWRSCRNMARRGEGEARH
ncbi:uncharacterized protein BDZ99DRAFT_64828 [Mytilinidion resinicola]|uniref:Uncharacterized protein n=1 Tax=Mytilinidion resinicola TaxID=574789 RepID=A0A6A6YGL3_9PEZI|nr:uncharacterized protein BDZ99DRAFT_64828 [Mytilinidion resinicola]KAF2807739.1 hypothetical protein BDZ99DRAFT_64828 [Mytilinidion resinicola]